MSQERHTASSITDDALDALYENASKGWRRGDIWKAKAVEIEADRDRADKALAQAEQQVKRLGLMVDEYGAGASALTSKLKRVRDLHKPMGRGPFTVCTHCSGWDGARCLGVVTPYPCDTLTALDEPTEG